MLREPFSELEHQKGSNKITDFEFSSMVHSFVICARKGKVNLNNLTTDVKVILNNLTSRVEFSIEKSEGCCIYMY